MTDLRIVDKRGQDWDDPTPAAKPNATPGAWNKPLPDTAKRSVPIPSSREVIETLAEWFDAIGFDGVAKSHHQVMPVAKPGSLQAPDGTPLEVIGRVAMLMVEFQMTTKLPDEKKLAAVQKRMERNGMAKKLTVTENQGPQRVAVPRLNVTGPIR